MMLGLLLSTYALTNNDTYITEETSSPDAMSVATISLLSFLSALFSAKFGKELLRKLPCLKNVDCLQEGGNDEESPATGAKNEPAESVANVDF